jgi:hypothetical protein
MGSVSLRCSSSNAQRPSLAARGRQVAALIEGLERTEDAEVHVINRAGSSQRIEAPRGGQAAVTALSPRSRRAATATGHDRRDVDLNPPAQEAAMSQAVPAQHPAVVLRSHYRQLRALLAIALIAVVGLSAAVVILATDDATSTPSAPVVSAPAEQPDGPRYLHSPGQGYGTPAQPRE